MTDFQIIQLFPTPIYRTKINFYLNKQEENFINKVKRTKNIENQYSINNYILEEKIFKDLKLEFLRHLKIYQQQIIQNKTVDIYITQSWLNWTKQQEAHHVHRHPNSLLSGVFYLKTSEEDAIRFYSPVSLRDFSFISEEQNVFNSLEWKLPVKQFELLIFNSNLTHSVDLKKSNQERISLAFNTFVRGSLGDPKDLDYLEIK